MKRTNDPSRNRPCLGVGLDAFSLLFTAQPRHSDISAHFSRSIFICFFFPLLTSWAFSSCTYLLSSACLFSSSAVPFPRPKALITNFFASLGFALSMICQSSCQSLMYRCEWHGFIDILYDRWSMRPLSLLFSLSLRLLAWFFFRPRGFQSPRVPLVSYL
jgi:hypothetical protein